METQNEFKIATGDELLITDDEIVLVLNTVYVEGGFTPRDDAITLFQPSTVRKRGTIIGSRQHSTLKLSGFVIVVPHDSPARKFATNNQGEIHLLGVMPEFRKHRIGSRLIDASIEMARQNKWSKLILWTQPSMTSAQKIYVAAGFRHTYDFELNGRKFMKYELELRY